MNEDFKRQLEIALCEPAPPEKLIESTVQRCQAVTCGRLAEERLAGESRLSSHEKRELAADALLGRLSLRMELPKELNRAWLFRQDAFCRAAAGPAKDILAGVQQGSLLRQITARGERRISPEPAERSNSGPDRKR